MAARLVDSRPAFKELFTVPSPAPPWAPRPPSSPWWLSTQKQNINWNFSVASLAWNRGGLDRDEMNGLPKLLGILGLKAESWTPLIVWLHRQSSGHFNLFSLPNQPTLTSDGVILSEHFRLASQTGSEGIIQLRYLHPTWNLLRLQLPAAPSHKWKIQSC